MSSASPVGAEIDSGERPHAEEASDVLTGRQPKMRMAYSRIVPWRAQFIRPRRGRVVAGVCAAIADRYGSSRTGVRALFVASLLLPGPQILAYLVGWAVFRKEPAGSPAPPAR